MRELYLDMREENHCFYFIDNIEDKNIIPLKDIVPDISFSAMQAIIGQIKTTGQLVDAFVKASNKYWYIADNTYNFIPGTKEYEDASKIIAEWKAISNELLDRIIVTINKEEVSGIKTDSDVVKQIKAFMKQYKYVNGSGWWVKVK